MSVALIAASRSGSAAPRADAIPQIPHMRDYFIQMIAEFGAQQDVQLVLLLVCAAALLLLADPLRIPYPILLVLGGLLLGFTPGLPDLTLPPEIVLVGILPPLLYSSAYRTSLRDLRRNLRPISLLAVGLVVATMVSVGAVAHEAMGFLVARSLRPGCRRFADRPDRSDRDRAEVRRPAAAGRDHRG
jgi:hypothetical protein